VARGLFLGKVAPLTFLGAYGIARSLSDPIGALVVRLCNYIVFPIFASTSDIARDDLRRQAVSMRMKSLMLGALALSLFAAVADLPVKILFDQRYQATAWMLPILAIGLWFSIICSINETTLLGFGKPHYSAFANALKFCYLLVALPLGFIHHGPLGAVMAVAVSDISRYGPSLFGQIRERFSFGIQDLCLTLILFELILDPSLGMAALGGGVWEVF
jgi:O-antigen/teichoic acid export membrane protein